MISGKPTTPNVLCLGTFVIEDKSKLYIGIMPRRGSFIIVVLTYVDVRYVYLGSKVLAHL